MNLFNEFLVHFNPPVLPGLYLWKIFLDGVHVIVKSYRTILMNALVFRWFIYFVVFYLKNKVKTINNQMKSVYSKNSRC